MWKVETKPFSISLGMNQFGDTVNVDLQKKAVIYIDGKPNSGKSVMLTTSILTYLKSVDFESIPRKR